ncbi:MAG: glutaminase [Phormidesmis sp.]
MVPLQKFINDFHSRYRTLDEGQLASYIPELTKADSRWFGISIVTTDGQIFDVGDTQQNFTI